MSFQCLFHIKLLDQTILKIYIIPHQFFKNYWCFVPCSTKLVSECTFILFELYSKISILCRLLDLTQHNVWSRSVQVMEQISNSDEDNDQDCSHLSALNLAHNQFTAIPTVLSCLAVNLTRLNMAYNRYIQSA